MLATINLSATSYCFIGCFFDLTIMINRQSAIKNRQKKQKKDAIKSLRLKNIQNKLIN